MLSDNYPEIFRKCRVKISLASPVYNESEKIQDFIHRAIKALQMISKDIEVVLVNDCSSDNTVEKIRELLPQYPCIKLINLTENVGQHIATSVALQHTSGEFVFMMDSDLQTAPEYMIDFFNYGQETKIWDVISAFRMARSQYVSRKLGSRIISTALQTICKSKLKDIGSTFKLLKRGTLSKLLSQDILVQNLPILVINMRLNVIEYPIEYGGDQERGSHYKISDLIYAIILALLNFTTGGGTLVALVMLGIVLSFGGIISVLCLILWGMINNQSLPTNVLLFSSFAAIVGVQLMLLSMVVFKLERVNKNLDFRRFINQKIEYDN